MCLPADLTPIDSKPDLEQMRNIQEIMSVIPTMPAAPAQMDALREQIRRIEAGDRVSRGVLPFGVPEIDERLPGGGLGAGSAS